MSPRWEIRKQAQGLWFAQLLDGSVWKYTDTWAEAVEFIASNERRAA